MLHLIGRSMLLQVKGNGKVLYYKPVQTGFPNDSDADQVRPAATGFI